jgi:hypothetical protein
MACEGSKLMYAVNPMGQDYVIEVKISVRMGL